ncbi:MAG TPA: DNA gyrase inhibitor YacG [Pirellulales bacterium]|nr:DNA gyrase inhibitor YacG [Pirellulales bacterium]
MRCPTCGKRFEESNSPTLPFCSSRCRQVDLNRWLSEDQRLPIHDVDDEGEDGPPLDRDDVALDE